MGSSLEEAEQVQLKAAVAGRRDADGDEEPAFSKRPESEFEAGQARREHQGRVDASELPAHHVLGLTGVDDELGAEGPGERQSFLTDVDTYYPVAEVRCQLDGVVTEASRRADHRHRPPGQHVVRRRAS